MRDQSAMLAGFLSALCPDADVSALKTEIVRLFPGITKEEWMRGFAIHDECVLIDALYASERPFSVKAEMAALGWPVPA